MFLSTNLSHIRSKDRRYSAGKMSRESDIPRRFTGAFQAAQIESPPRSVKPSRLSQFSRRPWIAPLRFSRRR